MADAPSTGRETIRAQQLEQLRSLIRAVRPANAFYENKLNAAGINDSIASLDDFAEHCPFTTKDELVADQTAHAPYGTNLSFPIDQYNRIHQTSGTTGQPLRWLDTPESWQSMLESWQMVYRAAGVSPTDRALFAFSFGPFIGFWMAYEAATQMGCLCFPGGGLTSTTRLRILLENEVTLLCCTPTYALRLAEVAKLEDIDLSRAKLKTIIVAGEPGGSIPATRERIENAWPNAKVFDHHGMTEVGPVTHEWPHEKNNLQIIDAAYFAEIIHPETDQPVADGEEGELILTTLTRTAMPLIRYRTGDLGRPETHRDAIILRGGILGRADDMVIIRGVNIYPSAFEHILRPFEAIAEYQVIISKKTEMAELRLRIEPRPDTDPKTLGEQIIETIRTQLNLRVPVETVPPESLPRFELKANRWIKE
ncbi:AMP-binding protein [Verrucomicrobia bacterium]|nr:AMP-binding protein [Verrucomicrobiota bacterium]MDC0219314.1 AMP-binding protein [Verrucomicrobiota bacterium]